MPLLPGKDEIGHNVTEMEKAGHPKSVAVAAALHTAYDSPEHDRHAREQEKYGRKSPYQGDLWLRNLSRICT